MARRGSVHFNPYQRRAYEEEIARWERRAAIDAERRQSCATRLTPDELESASHRPSPDPEPEGP